MVLLAEDLLERILVLAPIGRDAELVSGIATTGALSVRICTEPDELCREFERGAGAVFLTEEALYMPGSDALSRVVKTQESWSDLPFIVLTSRGDANVRVAKTASLLEPLGNVTVIERPVRPATILAALRAALRNRQKQYEVRRQIYQLRASYDRLAMTLRAASAGSWEWEASGDSVYWSPEFYDIFGLNHNEQPSNENLIKLVHPADVDRMRADVDDAVRGKHDFRTEFRILHPQKGLRWLGSFGKAQLSEYGEMEGMSGIAIDITDRKLAQQELEQRVRQRTRELTAANEEMQGFTYSVSHDLRAPLRAIVSTSRILLEEANDKLSQDHKELLERQALNANKLGDLIDELLKMSRLSRQEMQLVTLDISAIANEVSAEITSRAGCNGPEIRVQPNMTATGDGKLVRFLLQNLIENACKFSPNGGSIDVGAEYDNGRPVFYVRDQGIGFDMKYADKMFMPFERLVNDTEYPGTGIGLANVLRITARHGGRVWAESEGLGKGAIFYFTLGAYLA